MKPLRNQKPGATSPAIPIGYLLDYIKEDAPWGDSTSQALFCEETCKAAIAAHRNGVIAGLSEAALLFGHFGITVDYLVPDGEIVRDGQIVMRLSGDAAHMLLVERTALNIIGRMSGIASATRDLVNRISRINPACRIAGTRKTAPGSRLIDKKAIFIGGGDPHRTGLSDGILIKDNHLALIPLEVAVRRAKAVSVFRLVEVEVETGGMAVAAAKAGADIILLDNMSPSEVNSSIGLLIDSKIRENVIIEVSGGITLENIEEFALCGPDLISLGSLTHTVCNFDVSLDVTPG